MYGKGISKEGCILDLAIDKGIIAKSGSWMSYEGEKLGQGREKVIDYLVNNPDFSTKIEAQIRDGAAKKS